MNRTTTTSRQLNTSSGQYLESTTSSSSTAARQILPTYMSAFLATLSMRSVNFCQSTGEVQQRYMQRCYMTLMFDRLRLVHLYVLPSEQYHYSLGGVLGCHETHVLAASVSSPRLHRSSYTATINNRKVQLQLLIRCVIHSSLLICRTPWSNHLTFKMAQISCLDAPARLTSPRFYTVLHLITLLARVDL
jgi:hypothetical protein